MKLAVLADIHGNFVALQTITEHIEAWQPDVIVVAGDIVNRGPRSLACLNFVQEKQRTKGWLLLRGNHEDYVIDIDNPNIPWEGPRYELYQPVYATYHQLGGDVSALKALPLHLSLTAPNKREICITHASRRNNRDGIFHQTPDDVLRKQIAPAPSLLCVGHTHRPLIRYIDDTLVVNVGTVGLPFDGDYRPSYAQISWYNGRWHPEIIRLDYNHQQAIQDMKESNFTEETGPIAALILSELENAQSLLYSWTTQYQDAILAKKISIAETVSQFLANYPQP